MTVPMNKAPKSLKIVSWNAGGIHNKIDELSAFLRGRDVDVLLVSEIRTWTIDIPGYKAYTALNPVSQRRGGAATIIRSDLAHSVLVPRNEEAVQICPIAVQNVMPPSIAHHL